MVRVRSVFIGSPDAKMSIVSRHHRSQGPKLSNRKVALNLGSEKRTEIMYSEYLALEVKAHDTWRIFSKT